MSWSRHASLTACMTIVEICTLIWASTFLQNCMCHTASSLKEHEPACQESTLRWRHNERDGVSNHQCFDCVFSGLFQCKKISKLCVTGLCKGNPPDSPHKGPVTRKLFSFDDIMITKPKDPSQHKYRIFFGKRISIINLFTLWWKYLYW